MQKEMSLLGFSICNSLAWNIIKKSTGQAHEFSIDIFVFSESLYQLQQLQEHEHGFLKRPTNLIKTKNKDPPITKQNHSKQNPITHRHVSKFTSYDVPSY